jgi:Metalloenzyme superfamily
MKKGFFIFIALLCLLNSNLFAQSNQNKKIIVITTDGFRWQEVFNGLDATILKNKFFQNGDSLNTVKNFGGTSTEESRKKLLPFFWSTIAEKGQIHGNRNLGSLVDNSNPYWFSYPGYSEILTGQVDTAVNSNEYMPNPNSNFFEYLNTLPYYKNKVVAFGAWDAFKRILNEKRAGFPVINGNHVDSFLLKDPAFKFIADLMKDSYHPFGEETLDGYIKHMSLMYLKKYKPNAMYISFGDTDELAHAGNYPEYLKAANRFDEFIKSVYDFVNNDSEYKGNTTILITTDHGRGDVIKTQWTSHGQKINDSHQIWYAMLGAGVEPLGEVKSNEQVYQKELIHKLAKIVNVNFVSRK